MNIAEILRIIPLHGSLIFYLIMLFSVISFAIIIERFLFFARAKLAPEKTISKIEPLLRKGKILEAVSLCDKNSLAVTRIIKAGILKHDREPDRIKDAMEYQSRIELMPLGKYLQLLASIAYVAPLLGFAGTILGMTDAFLQVRLAGEFIGSGDLAGGIGEALFTTAAGIIVAIPSILAYNYFNAKIEVVKIKMARISSEVAGILRGNQ
jgi:biopolymer transport protein ExbB